MWKKKKVLTVSAQELFFLMMISSKDLKISSPQQAHTTWKFLASNTSLVIQ